MLIESLILIAIAAYLVYYWLTAHYSEWSKRGIPYDVPTFYYGSMKDAAKHKINYFDLIAELYEKHDGPVYGIFDHRYPLLMIRDPELIKKIAIKDFDHFMNHRSNRGKFQDPDDLFSNSVFWLENSKWRDMRSTLSPVFTGSKMRQMFELINAVAANAIGFLKSQNKSGEDDGIEVDVKDFMSRFTNDIIATAAFGLQVNSFENRNNDFHRMGRLTAKSLGPKPIKAYLFLYLRPLMKLLNIERFPKEIHNYFMHLVIDAMKYRKEHNVVRPDMIHLLMEARGMIESDYPKSHNREWTDVEIAAQCFLFFFAGFGTSSSMLCFTAHELMENPEVQQRLYEEVQEVLQNLDGKPLTYDALMGMKYMDMVISESLRKWPPAMATDRVCNEDITYQLDDGSSLQLKKGDVIFLSITGLHRHENFFPNSRQFDPERFSDENKEHIHPFTYIPFGVGPRNCIGNRFALMQAKALIFHLIKDYRIEMGAKTCKPLVLSTKTFQKEPENGFWLKFVPRK